VYCATPATGRSRDIAAASAGSKKPAAATYCDRHLQRAAAELHRAGRDDRQHVERREQAADAAGKGDARRHHDDVDGEMDVGQPREPLDVAQRGDEREAHAVDRGNEHEERVDGEVARRAQLDDERGPQEHRRGGQPQRDVHEEPAPERRMH
jgi:hypothetical protein